MISKELSATLGFAVREAKKRRHDHVSIEHVLFAILHDDYGIEIIEHCGGKVENVKKNLLRFFDEKWGKIPEGVRLYFPAGPQASKGLSKERSTCQISGKTRS